MTPVFEFCPDRRSLRRNANTTMPPYRLAASYHVVQNLPTSHRARTLAVDETSGWVYLVTPFLGVNPEHAMSSAKVDPAGNFEVLAIGK